MSVSINFYYYILGRLDPLDLKMFENTFAMGTLAGFSALRLEALRNERGVVDVFQPLYCALPGRRHFAQHP